MSHSYTFPHLSPWCSHADYMRLSDRLIQIGKNKKPPPPPPVNNLFYTSPLSLLPPHFHFYLLPFLSFLPSFFSFFHFVLSFVLLRRTGTPPCLEWYSLALVPDSRQQLSSSSNPTSVLSWQGTQPLTAIQPSAFLDQISLMWVAMPFFGLRLAAILFKCFWSCS